MEKKTYYLLTFWFFFLNLFDALATIFLVDLKVAEEVNPIMEYLLELGPWEVFFSTKMLVGGLFCYWMIRFHKKCPFWTKWSLIGCLTAYNLVMLEHLFIMAQTWLC